MDNFDDFIRKNIEKNIPPFQEAHWESALQMLEENDKKKKKKRFIFWIIFSLIIISFTGVFYTKYINQTEESGSMSNMTPKKSNSDNSKLKDSEKYLSDSNIQLGDLNSIKTKQFQSNDDVKDEYTSQTTFNEIQQKQKKNNQSSGNKIKSVNSSNLKSNQANKGIFDTSVKSALNTKSNSNKVLLENSDDSENLINRNKYSNSEKTTYENVAQNSKKDEQKSYEELTKGITLLPYKTSEIVSDSELKLKTSFESQPISKKIKPKFNMGINVAYGILPTNYYNLSLNNMRAGMYLGRTIGHEWTIYTQLDYHIIKGNFPLTKQFIGTSYGFDRMTYTKSMKAASLHSLSMIISAERKLNRGNVSIGIGINKLIGVRGSFLTNNEVNDGQIYGKNFWIRKNGFQSLNFPVKLGYNHKLTNNILIEAHAGYYVKGIFDNKFQFPTEIQDQNSNFFFELGLKYRIF